MENKLLLNDLQQMIDNLNNKERFDCKCKEAEMNFIKNLVQFRKDKGISQRDLANLTGLTQQAICSLEKLDRKPTLLNLIKYLSGLGLDINKIFK